VWYCFNGKEWIMTPTIFAHVAPRTSFYPGVEGTNHHHGKCVKLAQPTRIRFANAVPFMATAVSESGVPLAIGEEEMVSFTPSPGSFTLKSLESESKADQKIIAIIPGYYFATAHRNLGDRDRVGAYDRSTGQLE
jgi:hypothetical protein